MLLHFKRTHFEQASRNSESGVFGSKIEKRNSESGVLGLKTWEFGPLDMMRTPRGGLGSVFGRFWQILADFARFWQGVADFGSVFVTPVNQGHTRQGGLWKLER